MTYTMTLTKQTTIHYAVEVEASSLDDAVKKAEKIDTGNLDEAEHTVEFFTSDHDWEE